MQYFKLLVLPFIVCMASHIQGQNLLELQQRANSGDVSAMMGMGLHYHNGNGVDKDPVTAFKWTMKAAAMGHPDAMYSVALMYSRGLGTTKSARESANWITKAANFGHAHAQNVLANLYQTGNGVIKSFPEAFRWRRMAALSGLSSAQLAMASSYKSGDIVGKDLLHAYAWYNVAEVSGVTNARKDREAIGRQLTPEQIVHAQGFSKQIFQQVSRTPPPLPSIQGGEIQELLPQGQVKGTPVAVDKSSGLPGYVPHTGSQTSPQQHTSSATQTPLFGRAYTIPRIELEMLWVRPGTFQMGSPKSELGREFRNRDETLHTVTLTKGYWLGKFEVTQAQWRQVMGSNPSRAKGDKLPVEQVNWNEAMNFCRKLNEFQEGKLPFGYQYNLPTEAQWEYACRAGTLTATGFGSSISSNQANFNGTEPYGSASKGPNLGRTVSVGSYRPNLWGFSDMHGNAWEWCLDWQESYPTGRVVNPIGDSNGSNRVYRGGSFVDFGISCRSAKRSWRESNFSHFNLGFRLALSPSPR